MEVILLQRVEKLGKLGETVNVRPGFARNYLLPNKIALRATKENIAHFEKERAALEKLNLKHKEEAETLAKRVENKMVVLIRQASEAGHLYGSVSGKDIAEALKEEHINKSHVKIATPIKTIGIQPIQIQLHPEVSVFVDVNIAMSEDEAKTQAKTRESASKATEEKPKSTKTKEEATAKASETTKEEVETQPEE